MPLAIASQSLYIRQGALSPSDLQFSDSLLMTPTLVPSLGTLSPLGKYCAPVSPCCVLSEYGWSCTHNWDLRYTCNWCSSLWTRFSNWAMISSLIFNCWFKCPSWLSLSWIHRSFSPICWSFSPTCCLSSWFLCCSAAMIQSLSSIIPSISLSRLIWDSVIYWRSRICWLNWYWLLTGNVVLCSTLWGLSWENEILSLYLELCFKVATLRQSSWAEGRSPVIFFRQSREINKSGWLGSISLIWFCRRLLAQSLQETEDG